MAFLKLIRVHFDKKRGNIHSKVCNQELIRVTNLKRICYEVFSIPIKGMQFYTLKLDGFVVSHLYQSFLSVYFKRCINEKGGILPPCLFA